MFILRKKWLRKYTLETKVLGPERSLENMMFKPSNFLRVENDFDF